MDTARSLVQKYALLLIAVAIVVVLGVIYGLGFRVGPKSIERVGSVTLTNLPAGTNVYIDNQLKKTTKAATDAKFELIPGNHTVIIGALNDYPWSTVVSVISTKNINVKPLLVPMHLSIKPLSGDEKTNALKAIAASVVPTPAKPMQVEGSCANVYVSNGQLVADVATSTPGCTAPPFLCSDGNCGPTVVFAPVTKIDAVFAYPHRDDALVVAVGGTLYALSLDPTNQQFFAPLIKASQPHFGQFPDGTIIVQAGPSVATVSL
jgi:hypothetical protein